MGVLDYCRAVVFVVVFGGVGFEWIRMGILFWEVRWGFEEIAIAEGFRADVIVPGFVPV